MIRGLRETLGLPAPEPDEPIFSDLTADKAFEDLRSPKTQMALALGRVKRPDQVYGGTVPVAVVERRRAANRVARKSRRINRRSR